MNDAMTRIGITEVHEDFVEGWEGSADYPAQFSRPYVEKLWSCQFPVGKLDSGLAVTVCANEIHYAQRPAIRDYSLAEVETLEGTLLGNPSFKHVECPVTHTFAPGVYYREISMPKGAFIIGHCHKTEHLNVITEGRATVMFDGVVHEIVAPCVIKSGVGVRKVLYIQEDMRWATVHPTDETDLEKLEDLLITKSTAFLAHQSMKELEALKATIQEGGII